MKLWYCKLITVSGSVSIVRRFDSPRHSVDTFCPTLFPVQLCVREIQHLGHKVGPDAGPERGKDINFHVWTRVEDGPGGPRTGPRKMVVYNGPGWAEKKQYRLVSFSALVLGLCLIALQVICIYLLLKNEMRWWWWRISGSSLIVNTEVLLINNGPGQYS